MKRVTTLVILGASAAMLAAAIVLVVSKRHANEGKAELHDRFCLGTKMAMHDDHRAFLSGDPKQQEDAYGRFYEGAVIYHGAQSIEYCLDVKRWPEVPTTCELNKDFKCLGEVAGKFEEALP